MLVDDEKEAVLSIIDIYRREDLWGPCEGWPEFAIIERSIQQWAADTIREMIFNSDQTSSAEEIIHSYILRTQRCLGKTQLNDDFCRGQFDTVEMFKICIRTAKDILHAISDYYSTYLE